MASSYHDNHSVLDDLGAEVTGIAYPVALCMAITIFLVRLLQQGESDVRSVVIAEVIRESVRSLVGCRRARLHGRRLALRQSVNERAGGRDCRQQAQRLSHQCYSFRCHRDCYDVRHSAALQVWGTFTAYKLLMYSQTHALSSLYVQCVKLIYGYMGFATFMIFFIMTGGIALDLLQTAKLRMDMLSLVFILYNFAIVGSTILFFTPAPLLLKQVCSAHSLGVFGEQHIHVWALCRAIQTASL